MQLRGRFGWLALVALVAIGCGKESARENDPATAEPGRPPVQAQNLPPQLKPEAQPAALPYGLAVLPVGAPAAADQALQEKYDAALLEALNLLAEQKFAQALAALEAARQLQDTELVRRQIEQLQARIDQQAAAERTALDIQVVLAGGKAEDASRLASLALLQYGATDAAETLANLKRQADAILAVQLNDGPARKQRFRLEAEAALRDQNLRTARLALEQALQQGEDADLRRQLDDVRTTLTRYDDHRRRATELRRDPYQLEEAVAALEEAARAWDTLEVRQDLDEYRLALQKRRDRISVADFDIRGDIGPGLDGRTIAEELLPAFKGRFDLVERAQLGQIIEELKLQASDLAEDDDARRQVGELARARFLVLGSVSGLGGVTVHARLVDVRTGLVLQTARVVARTPEELLPLLPQLAQILQMSDEQKLAYEQQLARQAPPDVGPIMAAPVPPPPPRLPQPPPAIVVHSPRPPSIGAIRPQDFDRLPPPPPGPPPVVVMDRSEPVREKLLSVAVQLGDNLYLRGRYQEAFTQFDLALNLSPGHKDLRLRIEQCRPHLPPPPPVVVVTPPPPPRPRLAVLDFVVAGDPRVVPPHLGSWVAEGLTPYLCPPYQVVDQGEVYWYMGRLGMTLADLLNDPGARRWLGRALNVRYFLFGTIRQGNGLEVTTHLVDAEYGYLYGTGRISIFQMPELKARLCELARLTLLTPAERAQYERQVALCQGFLLDARRCCDRGEWALAIDFCKKGLGLRPDHVEIRLVLNQAEEGYRLAALEEARRRAWQRQQALAQEYQRRQQELSLAVEAVRVQAGSTVAVGVGIGVQVRDRACQDLQVQGRLALQQGNFALSIQLFESAVGLNPNDPGHRELAAARARAAEAAQARAAAEQARLADQQRQQRLAEQARLDQDRRRKLAEEKARGDAQAARDQAEYNRLVDQGQRLLAQEKYQAAIAALQTARQLNKTDEVERLLSQALVEQARATAQAKGAAERAELEQELAQEKEARVKAEADAQKSRELYQQALLRGKKALDGEQFDEAAAAYEEAGKLFRTEAVSTGLHQAAQGRARKRAQAEETRKKQEAEARRTGEVQRFKMEGQAAFDAQKLDQAVLAFRQAKELAPTDVDVLTALSKAEQARAAQAAEVRAQKEDQQRQARFRTMMDSARTNRTAKRHDAAVAAVREALKINPTDAQARALLKEVEAEQAAVEDVPARAAAQKKTEEYQQRMREGRLALDAERFDAAILAFQAAQKVLPGDEASAALLKEAQTGKAEAARKVAEAARERKEELQKKADVQKHLKKGRFALAQRDLRTAAEEIDAAFRLAPEDGEVKKAKADLKLAEDQARAEAALQQKQLEEFKKQLEDGRALLLALQYEQALLALAQAQQMHPNDPAVADLIKQAEKGRAASQQNVLQARQLVAQARALMASDLNAAGQLLAQAAKLAPKDAAVVKAQDDLRDARQSANAADKKQQAAFDAAMKAGRDALTIRRFDDAIKHFARAAQIRPGDEQAAALLRKAQQGREDALADAARKQDAQKEAEFKRLMTQGRTAMQAKRYDDAVKLFSQAVKLDPKDAGAARALEDAREELKGKAGKQAEYNKHIQAGANLEQQQRFQEAVKSYQEALRLAPGDVQAQTGIRRAEFAHFMGEGRRALNGKRFNEAERAFLEALQRVPGHPEAMKGLQTARQGKK